MSGTVTVGSRVVLPGRPAHWIDLPADFAAEYGPFASTDDAAWAWIRHMEELERARRTTEQVRLCREHGALMGACLDDWAELPVLCDWYEDHGREQHAAALRGFVGRAWRIEDKALSQRHMDDRDVSVRAGVWRHSCVVWATADVHPRPGWTWAVYRVSKFAEWGYVGHSPNSNNAVRRATRALLVCRRRECWCGRGLSLAHEAKR